MIDWKNLCVILMENLTYHMPVICMMPSWNTIWNIDTILLLLRIRFLMTGVVKYTVECLPSEQMLHIDFMQDWPCNCHRVLLLSYSERRTAVDNRHRTPNIHCIFSPKITTTTTPTPELYIPCKESSHLILNKCIVHGFPSERQYFKHITAD